MIHAYQVRLQVQPAIDVAGAEFQALLEARRAQLQAQIALYGGDPLPGQGVNARLDGHQVTVAWRLEIGPERADLIATVAAFTDQFTTIASWRVDHHRCGNGRHRPCGPWTTIMESSL